MDIIPSYPLLSYIIIQIQIYSQVTNDYDYCDGIPLDRIKNCRLPRNQMQLYNVLQHGIISLNTDFMLH